MKHVSVAVRARSVRPDGLESPLDDQFVYVYDTYETNKYFQFRGKPMPRYSTENGDEIHIETVAAENRDEPNENLSFDSGIALDITERERGAEVVIRPKNISEKLTLAEDQFDIYVTDNQTGEERTYSNCMATESGIFKAVNVESSR